MDRGDRLLRVHQTGEVHAWILNERFSVAHQGGLIIDDTNIYVVVNESPETLRHSQPILDDEMAQIVRQPIAVAREVPSGRRPVAARDIDTVTATAPSEESGFKHQSMMPLPRGANLSTVLLIDAANVVGSRPTGWWRDRAGAARRLVDRIRSATASSQLPPPVVVVLEGAAKQGVEEGVVNGVEVVHAPRDGDDTMAALAEAAGEPVILVSADRALGERIRRAGGDVVGPNWLYARLGPA